MTRNEWIAEAVIGVINQANPNDAIGIAVAYADALEAAGVAPWKSEPAPAKDDGEAVALLRRYVALIKGRGRHDVSIYEDMCAFLSRLDGKGGAK
jgi:hypothetical protein